MTSSSGRSLRSLFSEVKFVSHIDLFDLMVIRDEDFRQFKEDRADQLRQLLGQPIYRNVSTPEELTISLVLEERLLFDCYSAWIIEEIRQADVRIAALATYLPDIISQDHTNRRAQTIARLVNVCRLAQQLTYEHKLMNEPIVEIVAGNVLDPCPCEQCQREIVFEFSPEAKIDLLCDSLAKVLKEVCPAGGDSRRTVYFAVELEPGPTYLINSSYRLGLLLDHLRRGYDPYKTVSNHIALNVDLAHWLIAGVAPEFLDNAWVRRRVAHAHIADHPGRFDRRMHTRDHPLSAFSNFERASGVFYPFLQRLLRRAAENPKALDSIPFSASIALELEGANRIFWIHNSLNRLHHAIQFQMNRS